MMQVRVGWGGVGWGGVGGGVHSRFGGHFRFKSKNKLS